MNEVVLVRFVCVCLCVEPLLVVNNINKIALRMCWCDGGTYTARTAAAAAAANNEKNCEHDLEIHFNLA